MLAIWDILDSVSTKREVKIKPLKITATDFDSFLEIPHEGVMAVGLFIHRCMCHVTLFKAVNSKVAPVILRFCDLSTTQLVARTGKNNHEVSKKSMT